MNEPLTYRVQVPDRTLTDQQRRDVAQRLERVIAQAYSDQPMVYPSLIEELCHIIRFVADPPPVEPTDDSPTDDVGMSDPRR